jgi:hypothetical protein
LIIGGAETPSRKQSLTEFWNTKHEKIQLTCQLYDFFSIVLNRLFPFSSLASVKENWEKGTKYFKDIHNLMIEKYKELQM